MCMMMLGMVGGLLGGVMQAAGAQQQAEANAQKAEYSAAVERNNATAAAYKGTFDAERTAEEGKAHLASVRAAYFKSGVLFEGTPLTVFGEEEEKFGIRKAGDQYAGKIQAQRHTDQAVLYDMEAKNARKAGAIGAMSGIIGGISGMGKAFQGGGVGSSVGLFG